VNELDYAKSRKDIERYVLRKLQEIYWEFPWKISPNTTFEALDRHADPDLTDPGLLMDIEEDLGVYLPDEAVDGFVNQDVAALIDAIIRYLPHPLVDAAAQPLQQEKPFISDPWSLAKQIVGPFIERFFPDEVEGFNRMCDLFNQASNQRQTNRHISYGAASQPALGFGGGGNAPSSARLLQATLDIFEGMRRTLSVEEDADVLAYIQANPKEIVNLVRKRGLKRKTARNFVDHLIHTACFRFRQK